MNTTNPLLIPSHLPNKAPAFDTIREEHFEPAVNAAIAEARAHVDAIIHNPAPATFENTIEGLETAGETLGVVTSIFYNQLSANGNDALQALSEKIGPVQANFSSDIILNDKLFARVKAVHDSAPTLNLTQEQKTLLENTYKDFVRGGALLDAQKKARLRELNEEMSNLGPVFANNVKKSAESFELWIDDAKDLEGIPQLAIDQACEEAIEKGQPQKWLFTLDFPSYQPFITYAKNRNLREKIWRAFSNRAFGDAYDNTDLVLKIVRLRHERAQLLGYPTYAHFVLERRMAQTPETVMHFLTDLRDRYKQGALKDLEALRAFAKKCDGIDDLKPWDVGYYSEKLQEDLYHFSSEDLRPYFPLDRVLKGTFEHFSKLFDLTFVENKSYPTWHKDVIAYDVTRGKDGAFIGTLYADFYPRLGKKPGAWMTSYRDQGLFFGQVERPVTAIVCNFTKPTSDTPSLLNFDEVLTLFHEMGHATHGLLAQGRYASLSGTNVLWDFVELPSQIQENWLYEEETLNSFAAHYQTGEKIPAALIQKLRDSQNFMKGWMGLRQMAYSLLDMTWHMTDPATITDVASFEDTAVKDSALFPRMGGPISASFSHIFAGGYAAGYYSYKWAEVLDADAFEFFLERGLYNQEVAQKYADEVLAKGGTQPPEILYRNFRGRDADFKALLRREGLIDTEKAA
jgi:peptidyl-dipeptidase Dcp